MLPACESLKDTYQRVVPYFQQEIEPKLKAGKNILLSAHSNSLRALIKYLDHLDEEEIVKVNVPYCIPLIYQFDQNGQPSNHFYLATDEEVEALIAQIKNQTKD